MKLILNEHVGEEENNEEFSVTLTSFNYMAEKINEQKLNEIENEEFLWQCLLRVVHYLSWADTKRLSM